MVVETPDWSSVIQQAISIRDSINNGRWDDDYLYYMYDKVMITVFGPQYKKWEKYKDLRN